MGNNAVLLGGNWNNAANAGSRCSNWNNAPTNSNNNIGARGVCEDTRLDVPLGLRHGACRQTNRSMVSHSFPLRQTRFKVRQNAE